MSKSIYIILASFFLTACGADTNDFKNGISTGRIMPVNQQFNNIIRRFEEVTGRKVTSSVIFSDSNIPNDAAAACQRNFSGRLGQVRVRTKYKSIPERSLKYLVFHELGHCELNREHSLKIFLPKDGTTVIELNGLKLTRKKFQINSLMWPDTDYIDSEYAEVMDSHYEEELANQGRIPIDALEEQDFSDLVAARKHLSQISYGLRSSLEVEENDWID